MKKSNKTVKIIAIICSLAVILCGILSGVAYLIFHHYYGLINNTSEETKKVVQETAADETLISSAQISNLLFVITDDTQTELSDRLDRLFVLSMNEEKKTMILTSINPNIYTPIKGYDNNRLIMAYTYGKNALLKTTIENDFKVAINHYMQIDFSLIPQCIDTIGGIDLTTDKGNIHLTGEEALNYIHSTEEGMTSEQKQQQVIDSLKTSMKGAGIFALNDLLNLVLGSMTSDLNRDDCFSYLMNAWEYSSYTISRYTLPIENSYESKFVEEENVLYIDFEANANAWMEKIYQK